MFQVTCPFCYNRINWLRLPFVCCGRNAPGYKACQQAPDPRRRAETLAEEPMYPVFSPPSRWGPSPRRARCPKCQGRTGQHACPACHTPLPADFRGGSPVIGLIGATNTGKTVYLTVVANHLRTVLRDRFRADVSLYWDDARATLDESVHAILDLGTLPPLTEHGAGRSEPLVFQWRRRSGRYFPRWRNSYLSFLDTAGESLATQRRTTDLKFLDGVDAFILMLDPFTLPKAGQWMALPDPDRAATSAITVLTNVTNELRNAEGVRQKGKSSKPMAVVFGKIDALRGYLGDDHAVFGPEPSEPWHDDAASLAVHDSVREMLRELGASDIDDKMVANYSNYRYFALSALGRPPDYERSRVAEGGVRPQRVADPLVWLLSHYKVVPRSRGVR